MYKPPKCNICGNYIDCFYTKEAVEDRFMCRYKDCELYESSKKCPDILDWSRTTTEAERNKVHPTCLCNYQSLYEELHARYIYLELVNNRLRKLLETHRYIT